MTYKCEKCDRINSFEGLSGYTREEYQKLGGRKRALLHFRCPYCGSFIHKKVRPDGKIRTVKCR